VLLTLAGQEPIDLGSAPGGIDAIATLSDGQIAAADARGHVRILDRHGAVVAEMAAPARARMLRPSPDGRRVIAVPSYLGKAEPPMLLDVERDELVARLDGPQVYSARWVDGGAILTAHADGAARLWSADGVLQQTYRGGPRFLVDAALTPDRSMIVGGGGDGLLRFWDVQTGRPLWTMPAHKLHVTGIHFDAGDIVTRGFGGEISRWYLPEPSAVIGAGKISISKP
jgi:WD40 repeat protein